VIGDLFGPLNPGEQNTVRIVMNVEEAGRLLRAINRPGGKGESVKELASILKHALEAQQRKTS
jgi:hypothetical protein